MNTIKNIFDKKINKKDIYNHVINYKKEKSIITPTYIILAPIIIIFIILFSINFNKILYTNFLKSEEIIKINHLENPSFFYSKLENENQNTSKDNQENNNNDFSKTNEFDIPNDLKIVSNKSTYDYNHSFTELVYKNNKEDRELLIMYSNKDIIPINEIDNVEYSKIKSTKLSIYKFDNTYQATFEYKDKYYIIESIELTEEEFITLLKSIIK